MCLKGLPREHVHHLECPPGCHAAGPAFEARALGRRSLLGILTRHRSTNFSRRAEPLRLLRLLFPPLAATAARRPAACFSNAGDLPAEDGQRFMRLDASVESALNVLPSNSDAATSFSLFGLLNKAVTPMGKALLKAGGVLAAGCWFVAADRCCGSTCVVPLLRVLQRGWQAGRAGGRGCAGSGMQCRRQQGDVQPGDSCTPPPHPSLRRPG